MTEDYYSNLQVQIDNISVKAKQEIIDIIINLLYKDDRTDENIINLKYPLNIGGGESNSKYSYIITEFCLTNYKGKLFLSYFDVLDDDWGYVEDLSLNTIIEIANSLINNFKNNCN